MPVSQKLRRHKKRAGAVRPRPSIRLGPPLLWEELTRWAVRVFLLALTLIAARSGRIGERRARRNCHRRYQKERYHEKSKYALHSFSPPLRFSSSEQFHLALKAGTTT